MVEERVCLYSNEDMTDNIIWVEHLDFSYVGCNSNLS